MDKAFIGVSLLGSGYAAVMYWWNKEDGGFYEPWTTGYGRYATYDQALGEARDWAEAEELELKE